MGDTTTHNCASCNGEGIIWDSKKAEYVYCVCTKRPQEKIEISNPNWQPSAEENKYLELIASMTIDCIGHSGTHTRSTYINNLRMICDKMENIT